MPGLGGRFQVRSSFRERAVPVKKTAEVAELATLVGDIVHDSGKLLGQQLDLFRAEVHQELRQAAGAAASVAAGGGLAAAGGLLTGMMLAHLVQRVTRLPLWASYGVVGGSLAVAGGALLRSGRDGLAGVQLLPPPQTAEAAEENLAWLKEQMNPATP